jgi:tetratricopeptide (TPR) repeat protein
VRRLRKWGRRHRTAAAAAAVCLLVTAAALVGSVGWVLGDQANRQREAEARLREALAEAGPRLELGNPWDPALTSAAQRAEAQLLGNRVGEDLQRRVEQLRKDRRMLAELERIRLDQAAVKDNHYDRSGAAPQYRQAFQEYGIDLDTLGPEEAAALVEGSAIREHLVAGLDDWAFVLRRARDAGEERIDDPERPLAVARRVDPDPWRNRLRALVLSGDAEGGLEELARSAPVEKLPASTLALFGWLGTQAKGIKASGAPVAVLRLAQRRFPADFWINHQLAVVLTQADPPQLEEGIGFFRAAVALRPQSPLARTNLGSVLHDKGDGDGAIAEHKKAIDLDPRHATPHYNLGVALHDKGQRDEAIGEYRKAIELDPRNAKAHNNLGVALKDKGQRDEAIGEFRKALELDPKFAGAHSNLGNALYDKGQLEEAIGEVRKALELDPKHAPAHTNLGNALKAKGQLEEAIGAYRKAIELDPKLAPPHNGLGAALKDKGQLEEAIGEHRKAIQLDPKYALAYINLGAALCDGKHEYEAAADAFRKAIELDPKHAPAHNNLGNVLKAKGQMEEAIGAYRKAIELDPKLAPPHNGLGAALKDKGQLDEAIGEYRKAIELDPRYALAHYNLGLALADKGQLDEAIGEYRKAIQLDPRYAPPHNGLGLALAAKGQLDEAIAEFRKAIQLDPKLALAHSNLGAALKDKGQLDEAIGEYRTVIQLDPKHAEAHCNLGHALRAQGKFAEALDSLRTGHELGSKRPGWPYPSAQWVRETQRLLELDRRLPAVLEGKEEPADDAQRLALAQLCQEPSKKLYAASFRFYAEAFANDAKLADDLRQEHRYNAACAAALAGCGQGKDADNLGDKERARLRKQALDWLRDDLKAYHRVVEQGKSQAVVVQRLTHWQQDPDFAGVRSPATLAGLPEAERQDWQQLWADVADTLRRTADKPPPRDGEKQP